MSIVPGDNDKYDVLEIIGRGAFGIIRKVRRKQDGHILCRKEINYLKMSQKERDQLAAEFSILSSLKHPNIVGYFHREHLKETQELFLYMEYCGGGDLGCIIKDLKTKNEFAKEDFVWRILSQLITALYRCHYGVDAPEPGNDFARQRDTRQVLKGKNQAMMILHRDLKPENIFLGEDQSVKLGDFGLSKLMQSHDFASTYVGTPFYMSPEICAAEKYTLQSDIWSVGCIIYELCTKEPPFNANSHLQLVQRIRKGDFKPIPSVYSKDLANVISSCLKTNPLHRPDTASLLSIPYIWIARRQQEMVSIGKVLKTKEEVAEHKLRQAEERLSELEADKVVIRADIEAQVRREWEVKARLEIDRQIQAELERLRKKFEKEVDEKVATTISKTTRGSELRGLKDFAKSPIAIQDKENINPHSSVNTLGEEDFPSTTDLTDLSELSLNSPTTSTSKPLPKKTKASFSRSKTTVDSPTDVQMSDPSPMSISSLALSPRRNAAARATANGTTTTLNAKNIFAEATRQKARWEPKLAYTSDDDDENHENDIFDEDGYDSDGIPDLQSPTRPKAIVISTDPFKQPLPKMRSRPGLMRQNTTATMQNLNTKPTLFPTTGTGSHKAEMIRAGITAATTATNGITPANIPRSATENDMRSILNAAKPVSPPRRLTKIPSRNDLGTNTHEGALGGDQTSPLRRAATTTGKLPSKLASAKDGVASSGNIVGGRTLVELRQARAGGRPLSADFGGNGNTNTNTNMNVPLKSKMMTMPIDLSYKDLPPVPIWDPETLGDDMPSPFLKKDTRIIKGLR